MRQHERGQDAAHFRGVDARRHEHDDLSVALERGTFRRCGQTRIGQSPGRVSHLVEIRQGGRLADERGDEGPPERRLPQRVHLDPGRRRVERLKVGDDLPPLGQLAVGARPRSRSPTREWERRGSARPRRAVGRARRAEQRGGQGATHAGLRGEGLVVLRVGYGECWGPTAAGRGRRILGLHPRAGLERPTTDRITGLNGQDLMGSGPARGSVRREERNPLSSV